MDTLEKLILLRNIFYKCFIIGFLFLLIAGLVYLPCKCYVANIYQGVLGINIIAYQNMWAVFVGLIKTILIFLFLTPAFALHWSANVYKKKL